jgi:lipoprotein-anchoring transpeptidase ErfK/SrfK
MDVRKPVLALGILLLAGAASPALASAVAEPAEGAGTAPAKGLQLAQARQVEVYYDDFGRQVIVDAYTGRVIDVVPPRHRPRAGNGYGRGIVEGDVRRYGEEDQYMPPDARDDGYGDDDFGDDGYYDEAPGRAPRSERPVTRRPAPPIEARRTEPGFTQTGPGRYEKIPSTGRDNGQPKAEPEPRIASQEPPKADTDTAPGFSTLEPPSAQPPAQHDPFVQSAPALGPIISSEAVAQLQVALDRAGASPGVIDGKFGGNVRKALDAYKEIKGHDLGAADPQAIKKTLDETGGPAFKNYTITNEDAAGPYVASVPSDYGAKAKLDRLGYASVAEMLAERFHMDEAYLRRLNPGANFNRPGTIIRVTNVGEPAEGTVARIVANKKLSEVFAYDGDGKLIASYPATIGSTDTPSPSGTVKVESVTLDPTYTYNPKINFKQGKNDHVLTIPPGPNGPVGSVWIALSKPTYGIHGTPDPDKIGKTSSHGCVRLTNWDAQELAKMVKPGVWVQFVD